MLHCIRGSNYRCVCVRVRSLIFNVLVQCFVTADLIQKYISF
jgi:hypothetical protein